MDSLSFRIPEQRPPGADAFDTQTNAVRVWVKALPLGNMAESARLLHAALHETNRLTIPLEQRSAMLEHFAEPLHTILNSLQEMLAGRRLPLSGQALHLAEFAQCLLVEAVIAYQIVLDGEQHGSWLFRLTHHELWPLSIHRMLHYLGRMLKLQRLNHQHRQTGLWQAIHRLYIEADHHGRRHEMLSIPWEGDYRESIEQAYIQVILSALIDPGLFTPAQLMLVHERLPQWAQLATLLPPEHWRPDLVAYWIRLDYDSPHASPASQASLQDHGNAPALLLDLTALQQSIRDSLESGTGKHIDQLTPQTLEALAQAWRAPAGSRDPRIPSHAQHQAAIGLSALFNLMRKENRHLCDGISDQLFSDSLKPLIPVPSKEQAVPTSPQKESVWSNIFFATEITSNSWSMDSEEADYHYVSTREHDASPGGYRLEFRNHDLRALDAGELIGLRKHLGATMHLCQVRWIEQQPSITMAGVMLLAEELEPVLCIMHDEHQRIPLACLLGIGRNGHPQVFLPNLPALSKRPLFLVVDGFEVPITLLQRQAISTLFIAHHFDLHPALQKEASLAGEMELAQLNHRLHQVVRARSEKKRGKQDDFSDLWDSL